MPKETNQTKNVLVTLAFVFCGGPAILGVYLPAWITGWHLASRAPGRHLLALALIAAGLVPLAESIVRFVGVGKGTLSPSHPTETLVASGFYRHVRNPMYLGVLALIAGQAVLFSSSDLALYLGAVAIGFHLFVLAYEEPTLRRKYGPSYEEFRRQVPRWWPRWKPWT